MTPFQKLSLSVLGILALSGCSKAETPPADTAAAMAPPAATSAAADREAVQAVNAAWFKAFNAHDVDAITALYADDAVVSAPGMPPARGTAAIRETLGKDIAGATKAGLSNNVGTQRGARPLGRPRLGVEHVHGHRQIGQDAGQWKVRHGVRAQERQVADHP